MKRKGKFYSKNEKEVLRGLGLIPAPASGAGWIIKEDGENELSMVQLKSTDSHSYRLNMLDMKKLEYHAEVSNKIPIFIVQFLEENRMYAIVPLDHILDLKECLELGRISEKIKIKKECVCKADERKVIKSNPGSREKYYKERERQYGKRK